MNQKNKKHFSIIFSTCFLFILSTSTGSIAVRGEVENPERNQIHPDLITVFNDIPSDREKIDNICIRLLRSKVHPKNATQCFIEIPNLLNSESFKKLALIKRTHKFSNIIRFFEDIFSPIQKQLYLNVCADLRKNKENHPYIYYVINRFLRSHASDISNQHITNMIELLPLEKGENELIIGSIYVHLGEEKCIDIVSILKEKYHENEIFIQDIENALQVILNNKNRKIEENMKVIP